MNLEAVTQLCDTKVWQFANEYSMNANYTNHSILDTIMDAGPVLLPASESSFESCSWRNIFRSCRNMFHSIITDEGHCFTFNALNAREIYNSE